MCTAITLQSKQQEMFFGRTMDFSYDIDPGFYIIRKDHTWNNILNGKQISDHYRIIGVGQETDGVFAFFDGVNEKGFGAAALYFAGYAKYDTQNSNSSKEPISSVDFLHFILGQCGSVGDLERLLPQISIVGYPDPVTKTEAPLHWIATDISGKCVVVEQTANGMAIFQNTVGVLANSPDFAWHMTNLRNYMDVSPTQNQETNWGEVKLTPFGQGAGTMPLPGGYTSPERFVKSAYLRNHVPVPQNRNEAILTCFHIAQGVSIPKGIVITDRGTYDYTRYTVFANLNTGECFLKAYDSARILVASLWGNEQYYM
ncbi:putative protein YxeI [bioreactor metagenome]|uniref:Choloylglycine hydrolase/NAAA C-terminal domain-containing protein n=1 Tax=bioreactor metagenome TaxID=1076179 RepID=A0A644XXK6_9ZZZZ